MFFQKPLFYVCSGLFPAKARFFDAFQRRQSRKRRSAGMPADNPDCRRTAAWQSLQHSPAWCRARRAATDVPRRCGPRGTAAIRGNLLFKQYHHSPHGPAANNGAQRLPAAVDTPVRLPQPGKTAVQGKGAPFCPQAHFRHGKIAPKARARLCPRISTVTVSKTAGSPSRQSTPVSVRSTLRGTKNHAPNTSATAITMAARTQILFRLITSAPFHRNARSFAALGNDACRKSRRLCCAGRHRSSRWSFRLRRSLFFLYKDATNMHQSGKLFRILFLFPVFLALSTV